MEKTLQKIPFLRFALALAAGIAISSFFKLEPVFSGLVLFVLLGVVILLNYFYNYRIAPFWGLSIQLFFVFLGILVYSLYYQKPVFYEEGKFSAVVIEIPEEKPNSYQAVLKIDAVSRNDSVWQVQEKIMAWFEKSPEASKLKPGNRLIFNRSPQMIENKGNPFEFDYKSYLARKKIYRQLYIPDESWQKMNAASKFSVSVFAERIRLKLLRIYRQQNLGENEMQILSALTLGYKRGLDPETRRVFASAGAMHVLAVSGLHVGIVYMVLGILFGFLQRQKTGRAFFVFLVISALWIFAFLTGLSPSVSRAATMFSFVVIGKNMRRQTNIYNTLAASAFLLLLINPNNLFEVGFQLSYAAVFGIVFLQPRLEKLVNIRYKVPLYFWKLLTVSVAAQIATFPVSVFYFNQFPVYFWISNLFVIPAVIFLIPCGMALLVFNSVPVLSEILSTLVNSVVGIVYSALQFIENLPHSIIEFSLLPAELIFLTASLLSLFVFISSKGRRYFKLAMFLFLLVIATTLSAEIRNLFRNEIIVYNESENTIVHLISGNRNYIISEKEITADDYSVNMIQKTISRYRLDAPVYLAADSVFEDDLLCVDQRFICFQNRIFCLSSANKKIAGNIIPEIIIGTSRDLPKTKLQTISQVFVNIGRYPSQNVSTLMSVYTVSENGAFREKW